MLACGGKKTGRRDESRSTSAVKLGRDTGPTAYTGSAYLAGVAEGATGLECKPAGPKMRVQRGKDAALDQKKRSGQLESAQKERESGVGWDSSLLEFAFITWIPHDLREELKTDYSKHLY